MVTIDRRSWPEVVSTFEDFFGGLGKITSTDEAVSFSALPRLNTTLELRRDGTSSSFMPLHDLESTWESVTFDSNAFEVVLTDGATSYRYRIPPVLRD